MHQSLIPHTPPYPIQQARQTIKKVVSPTYASFKLPPLNAADLPLSLTDTSARDNASAAQVTSANTYRSSRHLPSYYLLVPLAEKL